MTTKGVRAMDETALRTDFRPGEAVRCRCGATGRYVGHFMGKYVALFVSAQDNDLSLDEVNLAAAPWENSPLPSDPVLGAVRMGLQYGLRLAAQDPS